jgi:hypothetical protein
MRINKYKAIKCTVNGIEFDSRKEARRYQELLLLERAGVIQNLQLQERFLLIPSQFETIPTGEYYKTGSKKGIAKTKEVCIEKAVVYVADFTYIQDGKKVVEDTKGIKTKDYIIKRKLMLYTHGIRVKEV